MDLDLPDIEALPELEDSERWGELLDSIAAAKERREKLRERADEIEQELPEHAERIEDLRVAVATGEATESDLDAAKEKRAELREELEELREEEIPAQIDTIELLEDRRSEVKSEEGDKFAGEYAEVQRALQKRKRELLEGLAEVLEALDEYQGLKKSNDVGSYDPDVPDVPPVHPTIQGPARSDRVKPDRLRRRADAVADTLETLDAE